RVLDADVAWVVLPIDERRSICGLHVGHLTQRYLRPLRRRDENVPDLVRRLTELRLQSDDEIECPLALYDRCRGGAADGGVDQAIEVGDIEAIPRHLRAIGGNR